VPPWGCTIADHPGTMFAHGAGGAAYNTKGGTCMSSVLYVGMDVDKEKIVIAKLMLSVMVGDPPRHLN
jgi:hypothetical protein